MRCSSSSIVLVSCLCLLALQLSGLHLHVDGDGFAGAPQGTHVHSQDLHSHESGLQLDGVGIDDPEHFGDQDHEGDRDVSIVKLSVGASKLVLFVFWLGLALLIVQWRGDKILSRTSRPHPAVRRERWRPPLRGPPQVSTL